MVVAGVLSAIVCQHYSLNLSKCCLVNPNQHRHVHLCVQNGEHVSLRPALKHAPRFLSTTGTYPPSCESPPARRHPRALPEDSPIAIEREKMHAWWCDQHPETNLCEVACGL